MADTVIEALMPMRMVTLATAGLAGDTNDRDVWRFAQAHQMVLLTANRRRRGQDSLEQTLREEHSATSLPVVTIGNPNRVHNKAYREQCATRLAEICLDIENHRGIGRVFIP